jgi:hypothetical protein
VTADREAQSCHVAPSGMRRVRAKAVATADGRPLQVAPPCARDLQGGRGHSAPGRAYVRRRARHQPAWCKILVSQAAPSAPLGVPPVKRGRVGYAAAEQGNPRDSFPRVGRLLENSRILGIFPAPPRRISGDRTNAPNASPCAIQCVSLISLRSNGFPPPVARFDCTRRRKNASPGASTANRPSRVGHGISLSCANEPARFGSPAVPVVSRRKAHALYKLARARVSLGRLRVESAQSAGLARSVR